MDSPLVVEGINLDGNTNARDWAIAFCFTCQRNDLNPQNDIGLMTGWFANAIEIARAAGENSGILAGREGALTDDEQLDIILDRL